MLSVNRFTYIFQCYWLYWTTLGYRTWVSKTKHGLKNLKWEKAIWCFQTSSGMVISWVTQVSETNENENDQCEGRFENTAIWICGLWLQNSFRILCVVETCLFKRTIQF